MRPLSPYTPAPPLPLGSAIAMLFNPGCVGRQLYPIHVRAAVGIGKVFHCNIAVRSHLNPMRAVAVIGNRFGPNGEVRAAVGIGTPCTTWFLASQFLIFCNFQFAAPRYTVSRTAPRYTVSRTAQEAGCPQGRSGQVRKISPPPGFYPRTVQAVAQLLYRLSYLAHPLNNNI